MEPLKDPVAVIALDFGTARSGYAFSFIDPVKVETNQFELEDTREKVSTCLLLTGDKGGLVFRAFGNEADGKLPVLDQEATQIHAFKHFKMNLFDEMSTVKAHNGTPVPVVDVIAYSLKFLANSAINQVNECNNGRDITMLQVQWVVTVPAIWNDSAKHVMRVAAQKAGLPPTLILALEPEAASLCCRQNRRELRFEPGTKYMVVDCGGGTVDIAVHEIDEQGFTQSKYAPAGGPWGSTVIDTNFKRLLFDIFGPEIQQNTFDFAEIMATFEREKVKFTPNQKLIAISMMDFKPKNLAKVNERFPYAPIKFERNKLWLPTEVMVSLYASPINAIISCVKYILEKLKCNMDYIFLVGGFSRSVILKEAMIQEFQSEMTKIVLPNNPGMAVAEGAVHFGLNPKVIVSRYSSLTYGIECRERFIAGHHPEENKIKIGDIIFCDNIFAPFVKINQKVKLNHKVSTFVGRVSKNHEIVLLPIYCTKLEDAQYVTPEMHKLGDLSLEVPLDEELGTHNVKVTMVFGGTEIFVKARHILTKKKVTCHLEFTFTSKSEISALPLPIN